MAILKMEDIRLGAPLEIYINRDGYNYKVVSKIEDVQPNRIGVSLIASRTKIFRFLDTDIIDLVYRVEDKMWKWKSVRGDVAEIDGSMVHVFYLAAEAEPYNRRNSFRLSLDEKIIIHHRVRDPIKLRRLLDNGAIRSQSVLKFDKTLDAVKEDCYRFVDYDCFIKDISEEGAGFYCDDILEKGDEISFEFSTEFGMIACEALIVRTRQNNEGMFDNYYGCRFTQTSSNLVKFLYDTQRKLLKKKKSL